MKTVGLHFRWIETLSRSVCILQMDLENRLRQRIELQKTHAQQMQYKAMRVQAEKEEEDQFRQQVH